MGTSGDGSVDDGWGKGVFIVDSSSYQVWLSVSLHSLYKN